MSKSKKAKEITTREVAEVKKLVRRVAMEAARDPETTKILFCTSQLHLFLMKMRTNDSEQWKRLIIQETEKISKKEGIELKPASKKIIMRGAMKFLRELKRPNSPS